MMVLCISAINPKARETHGSDSGSNVKIELTDGWYELAIVVFKPVVLLSFLMDFFIKQNSQVFDKCCSGCHAAKTAECWKIVYRAEASGKLLLASFKYFVWQYIFLVRSFTSSILTFLLLI